MGTAGSGNGSQRKSPKRCNRCGKNKQQTDESKFRQQRNEDTHHKPTRPTKWGITTAKTKTLETAGRPHTENHKKQCTLVIGDTNARLHGHMSEVEKAIIGPHCFEPSRLNTQGSKEEELDNRQELVDFCLKAGTYCQTLSSKHPTNTR